TNLPMTEIALSAGYGSVRRFNDHIKQVYGRSPSDLRGRVHRQYGHRTGTFLIRLPYRPPYDFAGVLGFLGIRATPGVEFVADGIYARSVCVDGQYGALSVEQIPDKHQLLCNIDIDSAQHLMRIVERIRRMFDLNADPLEIGCSLSRDKKMKAVVARNPGRRVPGAWDPFEVAVRAIVGQQVAVKGATTVMGKIAQSYGEKSDGRLYFPTPESLSMLDVDKLPMPRARASAIRDMALGVVNGTIDFASHNPAMLVSQLTAIKGIGPWTAQYVAMRAMNDPDAFLSGDLVLRRVASEKLGIDTEAELLERSQRWRPWRAYAGMHLWSMASE
ncbi:MAG: DNA-3-methyladenine glycosylase 2, partial [Pseudomonadales bacterium]